MTSFVVAGEVVWGADVVMAGSDGVVGAAGKPHPRNSS